jgi:hypothetical protein
VLQLCVLIDRLQTFQWLVGTVVCTEKPDIRTWMGMAMRRLLSQQSN